MFVQAVNREAREGEHLRGALRHAAGPMPASPPATGLPGSEAHDYPRLLGKGLGIALSPALRLRAEGPRSKQTISSPNDNFIL